MRKYAGYCSSVALLGLLGAGIVAAQTLAGFAGASIDGRDHTNTAGHAGIIIGAEGSPIKSITAASWRGGSSGKVITDLVQGIFTPVFQVDKLQVGALTGAGFTTRDDGTFGLFDGGFAASYPVKETDTYIMKVTGLFKAAYSPGLEDNPTDRYGIVFTWERKPR